MRIIISKYKPWLAAAALMTIVLSASVNTAMAQSYSYQFTYQGRLTDTTLPQNGAYDFQFALFDSLTGGTEILITHALNQEVTDGAFTALLYWGGPQPVTSQDYFLETRVKLPTETDYTTLAPRQPLAWVTRAFYADTAQQARDATTAQNALYLGGVSANQYVQTDDPRLTNAWAPISGSPNYIQNSTTPQTTSNFNISGNGTAGGTLTGKIVSATTQYNIGIARVLSSPGSFNFFAGNGAGQLNTTGWGNSFFGVNAGIFNREGGSNAFFGFEAGRNNTTGASNSYFGKDAGRSSTTGGANSFFGLESGNTNTTGSSNSLFGVYTDVSANNLTNATAIGARAYVSASNALVLGQINGINSATADTNVGIGTTAPLDRLHVNGIIRVETLGAAGSTSLCRNANEQISTCSSSLRYKTNLAPFRNGLNLVNRLSPISFTWKDGGMRDLGLGAEDVAAVEPLLVIRNDKGEVEGVKYDRITLVLLNAVKEQQDLINKQQQQLDALRKLVCQSNPQAKACK